MQDELLVQQKARSFELSPAKFTAIFKVTMDDKVTEPTEFKGVNVTQIPISMNDSTTGYKLQGIQKDKLIVVAWTFIPNWISCV